MKNEIKNFVNIIENKSKIYSVEEIVSVCKRLNNKKRDFLFVNKYQGKHFPQQPSKIFGVFDEFIANIQLKSEKVLVIGFAETATAIGNYVSARLENCIYEMQTTREYFKDEKPIIEFKEEHSHAPSQMLYGDKDILYKIDKVLFVEDEITTGKTIINFINELKKINPNLKYSVASILNWQDDESKKLYEELNIETYYLIKGKIIDLKASIDEQTKNEYEFMHKSKRTIMLNKVYSEFCNLKKTRLGRIPIRDLNFYENYIYDKISEVSKDICKIENKDILVIGTEEFMYEPLLFAKFLEDNTRNNIYYHATTRSPIEASDSSNYILNERYRFNSCYENERITYLYNLRRYDKIFILTDTTPNDDFINQMSNIFSNIGCNIEEIELISFEEK